MTTLVQLFRTPECCGCTPTIDRDSYSPVYSNSGDFKFALDFILRLNVAPSETPKTTGSGNMIISIKKYYVGLLSELESYRLHGHSAWSGRVPNRTISDCAGARMRNLEASVSPTVVARHPSMCGRRAIWWPFCVAAHTTNVATERNSCCVRPAAFVNWAQIERPLNRNHFAVNRVRRFARVLRIGTIIITYARLSVRICSQYVNTLVPPDAHAHA